MNPKQQGDVFLMPVESIPQDAKPIKAGARGYVLAEGEATGHAHRIEDIKGVQVLEQDGQIFVRVSKTAQLRHEEHKAIDIPVGLWKVNPVKEYDHFAEEARKVVD